MSYLKSYKMLMLLLVAVSLILVPGFTSDAVAAKPGCVTDKNLDPTMISLQDLDDWITTGVAIEAGGGNFAKGYNNGSADSCGLKKMAILSIQTGGAYAAGHPIGSYFWSQGDELRTSRTDGVLKTKAQVATQAMMDVILDRAGINKQTVAVIIGTDLKRVGIAYFTLQYWGIPKSRIRVANGVIQDFPGTLTTVVPVNTGGKDFSVCNISQTTSVDAVRASLAEMMSVSQDSDPNTVVLDVRSLGEFDGTGSRSDVAFMGAIKTAVWNEWVNETTNGGSKAGARILDATTLAAMYDLVDPNIRTGTSYIY